MKKITLLLVTFVVLLLVGCRQMVIEDENVSIINDGTTSGDGELIQILTENNYKMKNTDVKTEGEEITITIKLKKEE